MKVLVAITLFLFSIKGFSQEQYYKRKILENDLDSLVTIICVAHPNPYSYIEKERFDSLVISIRKSLPDSATALNFFKIVFPLMSSIKDAHSFLILDQKEYINSNGLFLSFGIRIIDNKMIVNEDSEHILKRGQEIENINGVLSSEIIDYLKKFSTPEGFVLENQLNDAEKKFYLYLPTFIEIKEQNYIKLSDSLINYPGRVFRKSQTPTKVDYEYYRVNDIPVLSFHSIGGGPFPTKLRRFMRRSMREIEDLQSRYLVIDLRNNKGGNVTFLEQILTYFTKNEFKIWDEIHLKKSTFTQASIQKFRPFKFLLPLINYPTEEITVNKSLVRTSKNAFLGNVIVVTNQNTFSAAAMLADSFKKNGLGVIVGEQYASNALHSFGQNERFTLPNTKLRGYISTWEYVHNNNVCKDYFKVDYLRTPKISENDLYEDSLLKWVIEEIKSGRFNLQNNTN